MHQGYVKMKEMKNNGKGQGKPRPKWLDEPVGNMHTGTIWMTRDKMSLRINPELEEKYTQKGYHRGMK